MSILIVDDEEDLRELLGDAVISGGVFSEAEVLYAKDGQEGLEQFIRHKPEIVISDISMPRMDGKEMIGRIREADPEFKADIVVLTSYSEFNIAVALFKFKVSEYLTKPVIYQNFVRFLQRLKEQRRVRDENESFRQRLQEAERLSFVGLLAAGVAHEVNNPNTFIKGNLELLLRYWAIVQPVLSKFDASQLEQPQKFETVLKNFESTARAAIVGSERIRNIVSGMTALSRTQTSEKTAVLLKKLIQETLAVTGHRTSSIIVKTHFPEKDLFLFANEQEILQILINLVVNSADAFDVKTSNGQPPQIDLIGQEAPQGEAILIQVKDNGCGIPAEIQKKIFDPFFTTKNVGKGTGLGLSISKGHAERNGGTLNCESSEVSGTIMTLMIPSVANTE